MPPAAPPRAPPRPLPRGRAPAPAPRAAPTAGPRRALRLPPAVAGPLSAVGPELLGLLLAIGVVLANLDAPLLEDSLFWWVPQALLVAERGYTLSVGGPLPTIMVENLGGAEGPSQWADGLPDYAHPPLWTWWLAAWIRALGPTVQAVHLACLLPAAAIGLGLPALARRLGAAWAGPAALALPPVLAQLLRPELDLPLLAVCLWALIALVDGRWWAFAALGLLAPWIKEPGVLLCLPAAARALHDGRRRWPLALLPLLGLGLWGLAHGGLAQAERLPAGVWSYLSADLPHALWLSFGHQGRFLLLLGLPLLWSRRHRVGVQVLAAFALGWVLFFSAVGFRLQPNNPEPITHVRYFVPGLAALAVLLGQRSPLLALLGLAWLHARSPYGPEANLFGLDAARAEAAAQPWIRSELEAGRRVWVGQYQAAALLQPWAGHVDAPLQGILIYGPNTDPMSLSYGDGLVEAAYGEPLGQIARVWRLDVERRWTLQGALCSAWRLGDRTGAQADRPTGPPPPSVAPPPDAPPDQLPPPPEAAPGAAPQP